MPRRRPEAREFDVRIAIEGQGDAARRPNAECRSLLKDDVDPVRMLCDQHARAPRARAKSGASQVISHPPAASPKRECSRSDQPSLNAVQFHVATAHVMSRGAEVVDEALCASRPRIPRLCISLAEEQDPQARTGRHFGHHRTILGAAGAPSPAVRRGNGAGSERKSQSNTDTATSRLPMTLK